MIILKKLIFALPFLVSFSAFILELLPFLDDPYLILSFDISILLKLGLLLIFLLSASLFWVIFATLAGSWKFVLPLSVLASIPPLFFLSQPLNLVLSSGVLSSLVISGYFLERKLLTYLNFQPGFLLVPSIKQTITLLLFASTITFYLSANLEITSQGFKLPSSLIKLSLDSFNLETNFNQDQTITPSLPTLSLDQLELLQQNSPILKQLGIDPKILDQLTPISNTAPKSSPSNLSPIVEQQIQKLLAPYIAYIPIGLAVLFFLTLQSTASFLTLPLNPVVWLLFWIMEKIDFTKYDIETREVKKLVV